MKELSDVVLGKLWLTDYSTPLRHAGEAREAVVDVLKPLKRGIWSLFRDERDGLVNVPTCPLLYDDFGIPCFSRISLSKSSREIRARSGEWSSFWKAYQELRHVA